MNLPSNRWCDGSGRAAVVCHVDTNYGKCPDCGYKFRLLGVVPKHRPRFTPKTKD